MYATYAWNAGATPANVVADLVALVTGAAVNDLSASCNKAGSNVAGAASGWSADDAVYGVLSAPCLGGGPASRKIARLAAATYLTMAAPDSWSPATHAAGVITAAYQCSLPFASAGSVNVLATPDVLLVAASDWSYWQCLAEIKRDGPMLADVAAPSWLCVGSAGNHYSPRMKTPTAAGETNTAAISIASAYGSLASAAVRDRAEKLYLPMAPAMAAFSSVPVGECVGLFVAGGYGQSGDFMVDGGAVTWQLFKAGTVIFAAKRL